MDSRIATIGSTGVGDELGLRLAAETAEATGSEGTTASSRRVGRWVVPDGTGAAARWDTDAVGVPDGPAATVGAGPAPMSSAWSNHLVRPRTARSAITATTVTPVVINSRRGLLFPSRGGMDGRVILGAAAPGTAVRRTCGAERSVTARS